MKIDKLLLAHPSLNYAADLREICSPLTQLGIDYFSHVNIDNQQQFTALGLAPEFVKLYYSNGYHHHDSHKASFGLGESYEIGDTVKLMNESLSIYKDLTCFNIGHTFSIFLEHDNGKDCYHFATRLDNDTMNSKYLQMIGSLKQFVCYFKDKVASHKALSKAYDLKVKLKEEIGGYHIENPSLELDNFFNSIQCDRTYLLTGQQYLTKREIECLHYLAQGKTFEETAIILGITARTVKAHVTAIKEKTGCDNQFQLGMLFAKLEVS